MNTLFPFGFPWPTAMYLTLFVITATIYMVFMNYVLAGAIVLVLGYVAPGRGGESRADPGGMARSGLGLIVKVVRDWLPAILGLAITTGIAPLLFLQILYKRQFYTANLLLFNRFMLLLPALIAAYYMLYLIKSHSLTGRWAILRGPVTIVALACFSYTAWAWTENHVLSLHEEVWKHQYSSGNYIYRNAEIWPRLGYWITASFATLAVVLAWQLHWGRRLHDPVNLDLATRRLRSLALLGLGDVGRRSLALAALARQIRPKRRPEQPGISLRPAGRGRHGDSGGRLVAGPDRSEPHYPPSRLHLGRRVHDDSWGPRRPRGAPAGRDRHHNPLRHAPPGRRSGWHGGVSHLFRGQCRGDHYLRLDRQASAPAGSLKLPHSTLIVTSPRSIVWPELSLSPKRNSH